MPRHPDRDDGIKPCTGPKRRRECAAGKDDIRGSERTKKERVLGTKTKEAAAAPRGGKGGRPFSAVKRSARHARCPFASTGIKRGGVAGRPALPARPFLFVRPGLLMEEPAARAGARPAPACHWDLLAWPGPRIARRLLAAAANTHSLMDHARACSLARPMRAEAIQTTKHLLASERNEQEQ